MICQQCGQECERPAFRKYCFGCSISVGRAQAKTNKDARIAKGQCRDCGRPAGWVKGLCDVHRERMYKNVVNPLRNIRLRQQRDQIIDEAERRIATGGQAKQVRFEVAQQYGLSEVTLRAWMIKKRRIG